MLTNLLIATIIYYVESISALSGCTDMLYLEAWYMPHTNSVYA